MLLQFIIFLSFCSLVLYVLMNSIGVKVSSVLAVNCNFQEGVWVWHRCHINNKIDGHKKKKISSAYILQKYSKVLYSVVWTVSYFYLNFFVPVESKRSKTRRNHLLRLFSEEDDFRTFISTAITFSFYSCGLVNQILVALTFRFRSLLKVIVVYLPGLGGISEVY